MSPDAADAPPDTPPQGQGLFVTWRANPPLPGAINGAITVSDATFQMEHFEVVSDAGGNATTRSRYLLAWDATGGPQREAFPAAPVGVYTVVTVSMMSGSYGEYAYRIRGTWRDGNVTTPFEIEDKTSLAFWFDCNEMLPAAGMATLPIRLDLRDALTQIDFKNIEVDDGVIEVKDVDLALFRERLKRAFKVDD